MKNTKPCGVNVSTGRCKRGAPKDKDMCTVSPKTKRCVFDKFTEKDNFARLKM